MKRRQIHAHKATSGHATAHRNRKRPHVMPFSWMTTAAILLAILLLSNHQIVTGESSGIWDADSQFAPYQMLVGDHARAGTLLLWNPWCNGGSPDGFEPQFGALSPITVGIGFLAGGREYGFRIYWLLIWTLGGLGVMLLGRHLGAPPWGACAVALGFIGSGIYTGHAQATPFLYSIAFLPYVVWRLDVAVTRGEWLAAVEAGGLYGLSALAGHPAFALLTGGYAVAWVVGRIVLQPAAQRREMVRRVGISLLLWLTLGLLVISPTYIGLWKEGRGFTVRTGVLPRELVTNHNALEVAAITTLASPYLGMIKSFNRAVLWPKTDLTSCSLYVGAAVLVLAMLALVARPRDRWRWWLAALGVIYLALALPEPIPFRGWLYDLVPPSRLFKHTAIFRVYAMFSLVVLALHATCDLAAEGRALWKRFFVTTAVSACFALLGYWAVLAVTEDHGEDVALAHWHFGFVWAGTAAVAWLGWMRGDTFRGLWAPAILVAVLAIDSWSSVKLSHWTMHLPRDRWLEVERAHRSSLDLTKTGGTRSLRFVFDDALDNKNFCIKLPVLESYSTLENPFHKAWVQNPLLAKTALGENRVWFSSTVASVPPTEEAFGRFVERTAALGAPPLVVHAPEALVDGSQGAAMTGGSVDVSTLPPATSISGAPILYEPNALTLVVEAPADGWLWVTDRWAAGWQATVNGVPAVVYGGNFIFRALPVRRGYNEIAFTYHPFGYPWLVWLSWGTMVLIGLSSTCRYVLRTDVVQALGAAGRWGMKIVERILGLNK